MSHPRAKVQVFCTWSNLRKDSGFQVKDKKTSEKSKDNQHEIIFQSFPN